MNNVTLAVSATVKCNGSGKSGVMFDGKLALPGGDKKHEWGPTDGNGTATTSIDISSVPQLPSVFTVIVKDTSGNVVDEEPVNIQ